MQGIFKSLQVQSITKILLITTESKGIILNFERRSIIEDTRSFLNDYA